MFQFAPIEIPTAPEVIWEQLSANPTVIWIGYILAVLVVLWILILIMRAIAHKSYRLPVAFQKAILLITLPKEAAKGAEEREWPTIETIRAQISVAETLFSAVGGMRAQRGLKAWFFGREDHLSLEIVAHQGLISFYAAVPRYLQQFIEQQIHAQYPECQIEEVTDYNIFSPRGVIMGSYLTFKRSFIFPIKTYKKIDSDPLNALTNVMSKMSEGDGAAIQIIVRSAKGVWHRYGKRVASEMQQGKKLDKAMKAARTNKFLKVMGEIFSTIASTLKTQSKEKELQKQKEPYRLSPMEEEMVKGLEEKTSKAGMDVNVVVVVSSANETQAKMYLDNIVNSFYQFSNYEYGNSFVKSLAKSSEKIVTDFIYRNFNKRKQVLLNTEELASIYHLPLPSTETPNIQWLLAKKSPAPVNAPSEGEVLLGENIYRGIAANIYIKRADRRRHMYIIGMTGTGKSWTMCNYAIQDIKNGEGVCVIDPHGELVENILPYIPRERAEDVIIFNPADLERPIGLNMLEAKTIDQRDFAVQEMISIFYKLFPPEMIGPMFEHNMRNVMLTLMADIENPGTVAEIPRMFTDTEFQKKWVAKLTDPVVRAFWEKEMAKVSDFHKSEMLGYLISKVGRFVENEMMRNIIGQTHSGFDLREIMDNRKVLLVNLSKGQVGEVNSNLLGLIIVSKLQMAALGRGDVPEEKRRDFYLYIDEFQNFITPSIATILAEARKYRLNLIVAHQYIGQLVQDNKTEIRDAIFGNVGTILNFRIGVDDAETMAKQLAPVVNEYDVMNIEKYNAYVRLLIDNQASKAFNMHCFPLPSNRNEEIAGTLKQLSRLKYGRDRKIVEAEILERTHLGETVSKATIEAAEPSL